MAVTQMGSWCYTCQRHSLFQKQKPTHVLHLILTLVTFGLWGFVWIGIAIANGGKRPQCATCGTTLGQRAAFVPPGVGAAYPLSSLPADPQQTQTLPPPPPPQP